jgi:hypothetical protein
LEAAKGVMASAILLASQLIPEEADKNDIEKWLLTFSTDLQDETQMPRWWKVPCKAVAFLRFTPSCVEKLRKSENSTLNFRDVVFV